MELVEPAGCCSVTERGPPNGTHLAQLFIARRLLELPIGLVGVKYHALQWQAGRFARGVLRVCVWEGDEGLGSNPNQPSATMSATSLIETSSSSPTESMIGSGSW